MVAVPLPLSTKEVPDGNAPDSVSAGAGIPSVVIVNVLFTARANEVAEGEVIAGGKATFNVKFCLAYTTPPAPQPIVSG